MSSNSFQRPDKVVFIDEAEIRTILQEMEDNLRLQTAATPLIRVANSQSELGFKEKHLKYLLEHPKVNPQTYLANLRTMIKIRQQ